jgi:hypothetical protein
VLSRNPDPQVKAFAVWEPILVTDWKKPGGGVVARITDDRAKQFWDAEHLTAKQLAKDARSPQPQPECCTRNEILWDLAAVYAPDAVWGETMPAAVFFNGPVVHLESEIEAAVQKLQK